MISKTSICLFIPAFVQNEMPSTLKISALPDDMSALFSYPASVQVKYIKKSIWDYIGCRW